MAVVLFIINITAIIDFEKDIHAAGNAGRAFTVYSANIHKDNTELAGLTHEIQEIKPDIVLLLEISPVHRNWLLPIMQTYPYCIQNIIAGDLGFVFLSKFPVRSHSSTKLSKYGNSLLEAELEIYHKQVMFYGIHAQRPTRENYDERKQQFFKPARRMSERSLPVILAGDFNTTPYSLIFRKLLEVSGLKDSRVGFGWQPSWPTFFPLLWIPIDHILVSPEIRVNSRATGSYIGSDHYPVYAELSLY